MSPTGVRLFGTLAWTEPPAMINYTERLTLLMQDIVLRVPALSFIDIADVLVFARAGRSTAEGPFATCHCLTLPTSEPGYYFWRDRQTGAMTRRSEWFVTKSPTVILGTRRISYLVSFALPRFCDQALDRSKKDRFYAGADAWIAKLDTVVHELYHIDPRGEGIRRIARDDGAYLSHSHSPRFFADVAQMVTTYLNSGPDPAVYDFLRHDFGDLERLHGGVVASSFRAFPSYPRRFVEALAVQPPCDESMVGVDVEPVPAYHLQTVYTGDDLHIRHFARDTSRQLVSTGAFRAA